MNTYTLHLPAGGLSQDARLLDGATVVKDGFIWGAFLFPVLWFVYRRLWLAALFMLIAAVLGVALLWAAGITGFWALLAIFLWRLLVGLEASSLWRWTLLRRNRPVAQAVFAASEEEAEKKAFARLVDTEEPRPVRAAAAGMGTYRTEPVMGLFPEPERRR